MNMLANLSMDDAIQAPVDSVGGGGAWDSDIYATTVEMAYVEKSSGGAMGVHLTLKNPANSQTLRQSIYVTSGDAKGNLNYYVDKNTQEKKYLPGFTTVNSLTRLALGKDLASMVTEKKVIKVYDFDQSKEVPMEKEVLTELLGKPIYAGVIKQTVDKRAKGDDGNYHPTGETRDENEIDKFFRATDRMTEAELVMGATEATFFTTWQDKWKGQVKNRSTGKAAAGATGTAGAPVAAAGKPASLFG